MNFKKHGLPVMMCMILMLSMCCAVSAAGTWSSQIVLSVPPLNGSVYGPFKAKVSNDTKAKFYSYSNSATLGMDGRVVNSNNDSRSDWARGLYSGNTYVVDTTAANGYEYKPEISSDITQVTTGTINFKWSPDSPL